MASSDPALAELNFVLVPLFSTSHMIPMVDMAKLLATRGVTVTLLMTPLNAMKFNSVIDRAIRGGLRIRVLELQFPTKEVGLPVGCESQNLVPSPSLLRNFFTAIDMLQVQAERCLQQMKPKPSCIISDTLIPWTAETADKFQIPRINFDGMSCFTQLCKHNLYIMKDENRIPESGSFVIPNLPDRIEISKAQLPGPFNPGSSTMQDIRDRRRSAEKRAYGVVINSFEELEQRYVDEFRQVKNGKVWSIGPLSLCNNDSVDIAQRGNNNASSGEEERLMKWLDSWQPDSVVYVCLGSLNHITVKQFVELALGLEQSGCPFILVVKAGERQEAIENWILENGFENRTKERGFLIRGWAPQVLILSHPAIGGFLTHCGWNSTLEGISAGVPMITWPFFAEQFLNERFIAHVLKIGASVGAHQVVHLGEEDKFDVQVRKEQVANAIKKVMVTEGEGNESRKRTKELGEMAKKAVQNDASSHKNLTLLIEDIQEFQVKQSA